jgi:hypothetical protein
MQRTSRARSSDRTRELAASSTSARPHFFGNAEGKPSCAVVLRDAVRWQEPSGECLVWLQGRLRAPERQYRSDICKVFGPCGWTTASAEVRLESSIFGRIYRGTAPVASIPPRRLAAGNGEMRGTCLGRDLWSTAHSSGFGQRKRHAPWRLLPSLRARQT